MADLEIRDLEVSVEGNKILKGITLSANKGEVNALMGPNGSGKSTLAYTLMGHPAYTIDSGSIVFKGRDITSLEPEKRAKMGLFLSFQYPSEVPGVTMSNFLRTAWNSLHDTKVPVMDFHKKIQEKMKLLRMDPKFTTRYLNEGFSGGEKKRSEILQMAVLEPEMAILDETDSGLDIDSLKIVAEGVNQLRGPNMGVLVITHYQRLLNYIKPDHVHVMIAGRIVKSGGAELAHQLEAEGYDWLIEKVKA